MKHTITFTADELKSFIAEKIHAAVPDIKTPLDMHLNVYQAKGDKPATVDVVVMFEDNQ